jgi:hypothetical protein
MDKCLDYLIDKSVGIFYLTYKKNAKYLFSARQFVYTTYVTLKSEGRYVIYSIKVCWIQKDSVRKNTSWAIKGPPKTTFFKNTQFLKFF